LLSSHKYYPIIRTDYKRKLYPIFSNYINKYDGKSNDVFKSRRVENSIMVKEHLVSYFPSLTYDCIDDLGETIMNPANFRSSTVKNSIKDNINFAHPVHVYFHTNIIKPNFVGDSYL